MRRNPAKPEASITRDKPEPRHLHMANHHAHQITPPAQLPPSSPMSCTCMAPRNAHLHPVNLGPQLADHPVHDAAAVAALAAGGGQGVELIKKDDAGAGAAGARKHLRCARVACGVRGLRSCVQRQGG